MDIKKPQLVKVGAFAYFFEGVLQHPLFRMYSGLLRSMNQKAKRMVVIR